ncbi:MAG: hypothetical protein JKX81_01020 [Arenicella sp.]|nr:hypothetical protein [Arenicella sp.]
MRKKNSLELIRQSILKGNIHPELSSVVEFILGALDGINDYKYYSNNLVPKELINIYKKRLANLLSEGGEFGGFSETLTSLNEGEIPTCMVTADSEKYHVSILANDDVKIIGAVFVEH